MPNWWKPEYAKNASMVFAARAGYTIEQALDVAVQSHNAAMETFRKYVMEHGIPSMMIIESKSGSGGSDAQ